MTKPEKKCCACGEKKDRSEFNRDTYQKDGLQSRCRPCRKAYQRRWKATKTGDPEFRPEPQTQANTDLWLPWRRGNPAKAEDSLKYACMDIGFAKRGNPPGLTKRMAFCSQCQADICIYGGDVQRKKQRGLLALASSPGSNPLPPFEGRGGAAPDQNPPQPD